MSQKNRFVAELRGAGRHAGGAHLTIEARDRHLKLFAEFCNDRAFGLKTVEGIKTKHVQLFADFLRGSDRSPRTIHNILASLRATLRASGKNLKNMHLTSNANLGLAQGDRRGKKEPFPDRRFYLLLVLLATSDVSMYAALAFERFFGLRGMEAIRSRDSLETWLKQIEANQTISVTFGTKTGKPRSVTIHPKNLSWARLAIHAALDLTASQRSPLIQAPTLKQAVRHYRYRCEKLGLVGKHAPHSLRYRYAVELLEYHREQGYSEHESLARVAMSLGHGDGRGRWVKMVYARSTIDAELPSSESNDHPPSDQA